MPRTKTATPGVCHLDDMEVLAAYRIISSQSVRSQAKKGLNKGVIDLSRCVRVVDKAILKMMRK